MNDGPLCEICQSAQQLTFHHLIPKSCHKNKWFKKRFSKEEMTTKGMCLCRKCHSFLHQCYSEKYLGRELHTRDAVLSDAKIIQYQRWAQKHVK